jgi:hypothetical protein
MGMTSAAILPRMGLGSKPAHLPQVDARSHADARPAVDVIMWGVAIRDGYDELNDPSYHRGMTGHAFLEGNDEQALCGYRPPMRTTFSRRVAKLGIVSDKLHSKCEKCATTVVPLRLRSTDPATPATMKAPGLMRVALAAALPR